MKKFTYLILGLFLMAFSWQSNAQCDYTLEMNDSWGDGWNGNTMDVLVNGLIVLDDVTFATGTQSLLTFPVNTGDDVTTIWNGGGGFGNETSYRILDAGGTSVGSGAESDILTGTITAACPACNPPSTLAASNITQTQADLSWTAGGTETAWNVEWGLNPLTLGAGTTVTGVTNPYTLMGLTADTNYDYYVQADCGLNGTSSWAGPFTFFTGHCLSVPSSNDGAGISNVQLQTTDFPTGDVTYFDHTGTVIDIAQSTTVNLQVTFQTGYTYDTNVWIDLNDNLIFEASEQVFDGVSLGDNPTTLDASFPLGAGAALGNHKMRIGTADTGQQPGDPCYNGSFGVTLDFTVNVTLPPNCLPPLDLAVTNVNSAAGTADLSWTDANAPSSDFTYSVEDITNGVNFIPNTLSGGLTTVGITGLVAGNDYTFSVFSNCGLDTSTVTGPLAWNQTDLPDCVTYTSPLDGATNVVGGIVSLNWTEPGTGTAPTGYDIYFGQTSGALTNLGTIPFPATGINISGVAAGSTNYWMIVPVNAGGGNLSCGEFSFTTAAAPTAPAGVTCAIADPFNAFTEEFDVQGLWTGDIASGTTNDLWNFGRTGGTGSGSTGPSGAHSGANYMYFEASGANGSIALANSPAIDLTGASEGAELSFFLHAYGASIGRLDVLVSTDGGTTFALLDSWGGQLQTASADAWVPMGVNLDAYLGQTINIQLRYISTNGFTGDMAIDLFEVNTCQTITCPDPSAMTASLITVTTADLDWTENGTATVWDLEMGVSGFTATGTPTDNDITKPFSATGLTANTTYDVYYRADCGADNTNVSAWVGPYSFTTLAGAHAFPLTEDFESGFTYFDNASGNNVDFTIETTIINGGTNSVHNAHTSSNTNILLETGILDLSGTTAAQIDFWHIAKTEGGWDKCYVEISTDGGATYTALPNSAYLGAANGYDTNGYFHEDSYADWGTTDVPAINAWWKKESFSLAAYNVANVRFRFLLTSDSSANRDGWYIDDIQVYEPTCPDPNAMAASSITATTASLDWTENGTATVWDLEIGASGFTATGTPTDNDITKPFAATGLTAETTYDVYYRADCGADNTDVSTWVGPYSFTTPCAIYIPDYNEDFASYVPNCWEEAEGPATGYTTTGSSGWAQDGFANNGTTGATKFNLYNTGDEDWLLTPMFDLSAGGYELTFDVAVTAWGNQNPSAMGSDDQVLLLQSIDGGTTWTSIYTFNAANTPSNTGDYIIVDISALTSATVQFAFFADEGAVDDAEDYDFFVDNFRAKTQSCTGGTTTWSTLGWDNGVPNNTMNAVIDFAYGTGTTGNLDVCSLTVTANGLLEIDPGNYVKVEEHILVESGGILAIFHEGSLVQVDDLAPVTNNGTIGVTKTTPVNGGTSFSILGSPMSGTTRSGALVGNNVVMSHDTSLFDLDATVTAVNAGAEHFADADGNNWSFMTGAAAINPAEGYLVGPTDQGVIDGSYALTYNEGTLNNGVYNFVPVWNIDRENSPNILSNPYASAIDAVALLNDNFLLASNVYFWEHITAPSAGYPGYRSENWSMGDISIFNVTGLGTAAPNGGAIPSQFIPSGQGFAIKVKADVPSLPFVFDNSHRVTGPNTGYRTQDSNLEKLYINLKNETYALKSSMAVAFTDQATNNYDEGYETKRLATPISIYSVIDDHEIVIQARNVFNTDQIIPLGFRTMVEEVQTYTISLGIIEGESITQATVYLQDNLLNTVTNLTEGDYTFTSNESNQKDRFVIVFAEGVLGTSDANLAAISVYPNPTKNILNIVSPVSKVNNVVVHDISGRRVATYDFTNNLETKLDVTNYTSGVYFVEINTVDGSVTKRIIRE
ncbi:MAG: choice-of-anchor J domain-containing protein [Flavobacteriaceae bacterium]|nr:choice-of-anchor J domain-containing protein [Flavobacteriaceae bacterium]